MKKPDLRITAPDRRRHVDGLADLIAKTFGNYFQGIEREPSRRRRAIHPTVRGRTMRIARWEGDAAI